jgi:hypothetical protein
LAQDLLHMFGPCNYLVKRRKHIHFHRHSRTRVMPCAYKLGSLRFLQTSLAALLTQRVAIFSTPKTDFSDPWIVSSSPTASLPMGVSGGAVTQIVKTTHVPGAIACFAVCMRLLRQRTEKTSCFWCISGTRNLIPKVCLMPLPRLSSQDSTYLKIKQHVTNLCYRKRAYKLSCEAMHA